jgi:8-oxo-dGTP diphosphatase
MLTTGPDRIEVAAGVVRNSQGQILVGQRIVDDMYLGKWEFPGGKIEIGETVEEALRRELYEELGIEVGETEPLISLKHDYPDRKVQLNVLEVLSYRGRAHGREGQAIRWVDVSMLDKLDFLAANGPIMNAVRLPGIIYRTDISVLGSDGSIREAEGLAGRPEPSAMLVNPGTPGAVYSPTVVRETLVGISNVLAGSPVSLYVVGDPKLVHDIDISGFHFDHDFPAATRTLNHPGNPLIGATCSSLEDIVLATDAGSDYVFLDPTQICDSRPDRGELDWEAFSKIVEAAGVPVYAVGGLKLDDRAVARRMGGQGVVVSATAALSEPV